MTYRVIDSPHEYAEERVAGTKQLHFLSHEVFLLRLRFARNRCGDAGRRSHVSSKLPAAAVCATDDV